MESQREETEFQLELLIVRDKDLTDYSRSALRVIVEDPQHYPHLLKDFAERMSMTDPNLKEDDIRMYWRDGNNSVINDYTGYASAFNESRDHKLYAVVRRGAAVMPSRPLASGLQYFPSPLFWPRGADRRIVAEWRRAEDRRRREENRRRGLEQWRRQQEVRLLASVFPPERLGPAWFGYDRSAVRTNREPIDTLMGVADAPQQSTNKDERGKKGPKAGTKSKKGKK